MGGVGDALQFGAGEMAFEPACLLRQYAAGRGDLDDVGAGARRLAHFLGAFERTGAGIARIEDAVDILAAAGDVAVASSDERRVGEQCVSTGRFCWSPYHSKKQLKNKKNNIS